MLAVIKFPLKTLKMGGVQITCTTYVIQHQLHPRAVVHRAA